MEYENIGESRVIDKISEKIPVVKVYRLYENYSVPIIEPLTEADLLPETVNIGWNNIGGEWHYYHTTESTSMAKNEWVPCRDEDQEKVWIDEDGKMVENSVVTDGDKQYLVGDKGHKLCSKSGYIFGAMDYTTDEEGAIIEAKLHLATPSDAAKADEFVTNVMDNIGSMSEDDQRKATDMLTEALRTKVDTERLSAEKIEKYADFYRTVYGGRIAVSGCFSDENRMIVAAGLNSNDFKGNEEVSFEL